MRKSEKIIEFFGNHTKKFLLLLIVFSFVVILFSSLNRFFDHDELESIHTAWKIMVGEKIYIDFFQHHHSFFYYFLIPVLYLFNNNIIVLFIYRIIFFLFLLLNIFLTYIIAKQIFNEISALVSVILLLSTLLFIDKAIEIRPDVLMTLFSLISLDLFIIFIKKAKNNKRNKIILILSAFFLALSFLSLQKSIFFVAIIFSLLFFITIKNKKYFIDLIIFLLVFFITLFPYYVYLLINGKFSIYIFYNWIINMNFVQKGLPTAILSYKHNSFLWVFFVIGLLFFLKDKLQKKFGILVIFLLISTVLYKIPLPQYYMLLIPLVSIISGFAVYKILENKNVIILITSVVILLSPLFLVLKETFNNSNKIQIKEINYVLSISKKNDCVYDGDIQFNLFRKDIDFFWYSLQDDGGMSTYKKLRTYNYDIYKLIDLKKPVVISSYNINNINNPIIKNNYTRSAIFNKIYIRHN